MVKRIAVIIGLLFASLFLGILFLMIGMNIGGNFFTEFEFLGARGYEATGNIGFFGGITIGLFLSSFIYIKLLKNGKI